MGMGITIVIVGGIALASIVASFFSYLEKKKGRNDSALEERVKSLETKIDAIYETGREKDKERINKLENDLRFLNRLLENKAPEAK